MSTDSVQTLGLRRGGAANNVLVPTYNNEKGEQLVAQGMPAYSEMARLGAGWQAIDTNALAAVAAVPTTTAGLTLWNGEPAGGKSYVIDRVGLISVVTTAALSGFSIACCIHPVGMVKPTSDITPKSMSGKPSYGGAAVVDSGATVVSDGWFPIDKSFVTSGVGTTPIGGVSWDTQGRFLIPPSAGFSIKAFGNITGLTFYHVIAWWEVQVTANETV